MNPMNLSKSFRDLASACNGRVLVMDGSFEKALGTFDFSEEDYRGGIFADHPVSLDGDVEVLNLTAPEKVKRVFRAYLDAGADLIRTNTYNCTSIEQSRYRLENMVYDMAKAGAQIASAAVAEYNEDFAKNNYGYNRIAERKFVVGNIGPTGKSSSISRDPLDPVAREVTFRELVLAYSEQVRGLLDGGADVLMVEGVFDALNAKAALYAIMKICGDRGELFPVMVSGTVSGRGGYLPSGQSLVSLRHSVSSFPVFSIGFDCATDSAEFLQLLRELDGVAIRISVLDHLRNPESAAHDEESVRRKLSDVRRVTETGVLNIVGGDRDAGLETVKAMASVVRRSRSRKIPARRYNMLLGGLEALKVTRDCGTVLVGNRLDASESPEFARFVHGKNFAGALSVGKSQTADSSEVVSVNLDEGQPESKFTIIKFLNLMMSEPAFVRKPLMLSSSKWENLVAAMECVQGKGIARSISLREGEEVFLVKAEGISSHGFAVVCEVADENGVAETYERQKEIIERMYSLLVGRLNFPTEDILFEPTLLPVGSGHGACVEDFFRICSLVKEKLPYSHVLGDVRKVSSAFAGDEEVRNALHSVFLHHVRKARLDFALVDVESLPVYEEIPYRFCRLLEEVLFDRSADSVEKLRTYIAEERAKNVEPRQESALDIDAF